MISATIVYGDRAQAIADTLTIDGTAVDLSGCSVHLCFKRDGAIVEQLAEVVSQTLGTVRYFPQAVDVVKDALLKWKVTFGDGTTLHLPQDEWVYLKIEKL